MEIHYLLITDGSSDKALIPIINWSFNQILPEIPIHAEWADFRGLSKPPKSLDDRIRCSLKLYEKIDIYFIHRDGEGESRAKRVTEIKKAINSISGVPPYVCVIPIRMMEAWLLLDEQAIRQAAGNPNGKKKFTIPAPKDIEAIPDPKKLLHENIKIASELNNRRLRDLNISQIILRIPEFTEDFAYLRKLSAFAAFERDLQTICKAAGYMPH